MTKEPQRDGIGWEMLGFVPRPKLRPYARQGLGIGAAAAGRSSLMISATNRPVSARMVKRVLRET